jgi:hypothetical protein
VVETISWSIGGCKVISAFCAAVVSSGGVVEMGLGRGVDKSSGGADVGSIGCPDIGDVEGFFWSSIYGISYLLIGKFDG